MRVDVTSSRCYVTVYRDSADQKYYDKESRFLHHVKKTLQAMGYDCIKKLAYKDGNLVDDTLHYIRDRKNRWSIHDDRHMLRILSRDFDEDGKVELFLSGALVK